MQTFKTFSIDDKTLKNYGADYDKLMAYLNKPKVKSRGRKKKVVYSNFKAFQRLANRNMSTTINLGSRFEGDAGLQSMEFDYFAGVFTNDIKPIPGAKHFFERDGIGLRIRLKAENIKANMNLGFAAFAASAELELANVYYRIDAFGFSDAEVIGSFPSTGAFNHEKYEKILEFSKKTKKYLADNIDKLEPFAIEVLAAEPLEENDFSKSQSFFFGAKYLTNGLSLRQAIDKARTIERVFDEDAIQYIYNHFGVIDAYTSPSSICKNKARKWLRMGN